MIGRLLPAKGRCPALEDGAGAKGCLATVRDRRARADLPKRRRHVLAELCGRTVCGYERLRHAVVISADTGENLAHGSGHELQAGEGQGIVALFTNPSFAFASRIPVNGVRYSAIRADERLIQGQEGATGVALAKTNKVVITGYYDEQQSPGPVAVTVDKLADFLIDQDE
ncbi:profilin [Streptomyces sp. NPDC038707]|uniref:profilin n=1 Tax=unclassified Streptomyces TaxID=2593676 RepID=UPI0033F7DF69